MGIFGALQSAVSGLKAQSHAMENISGNIANSQTIGYKRIDTSFLDLIPDAPVKSQVAGAVSAYSVATNTLRGDIQNAETETYMALNGSGFFVVEPGDGSGGTYYTRRGDFDSDRNGYLVNGAGYRLTGLAMNNGVVTGSVAQPIQIDNSFLPAKRTTSVNYQLNLPLLPKTASYQATAPGSELLKPWNFGSVLGTPNYPKASGAGLPASTPAYAIGSLVNGTALASSLVQDNDRLNVTINGTTYGIRFNTDNASTPSVTIASSNTGYPANTAATTVLNVPSANLAALAAAGFTFGGQAISPAGATAADLEAAVAAHPDVASATYDAAAGTLTVTYNAGDRAAAPTTAVAGGNGLITFGSSTPGTVAGIGKTTVLNISPQELEVLHQKNDISVGNPPVAVDFGAQSADAAGLLAAFQASFPGATVGYNAATGQMTIAHPVPAAIEAADAATTGSGEEIVANGTINTMLADMQQKLRDLSGDSELTVGLKNGQIAVSLAPNSTSTLAFSSARAGTMSGAVLGLDSVTDAATGSNVTAAVAPASMMVEQGDSISFTIGGITRTYRMDITGSLTGMAPGEVKINAGGTVADMLAAIQADLRANGGPTASLMTLNANGGTIEMNFNGNYTADVRVTGTAANKFNINGNYDAEPGTLNTVLASDSDRFVSESISGGGITVYSQTGEPINLQMRWAKLSNETGKESWGLFYASDSRAGATTAWTKLADYAYEGGILAGITPNPAVASSSGTEKLTINNLSVNGTMYGSIDIDHGMKGMTQFADNSGAATTTTLKQNGYGAGEFISVGISDGGRVVASYSNGETREVAQIITASFSNANALKRGDGGAYTATSESGEAIIGQSGEGIVGSSTEASNTDISEEFTKLIVTQQAYSANTRIVSAADDMLKEALNMIR